MKKHRKAKLFLEELRKTPVVNAVCKQVDITRQTVYRWIKEDPEFNKEYEECMSQGVDNVNDLAVSQLIKKVQQGDNGMIKHWLSYNHPTYMKKPDIPKEAVNKPQTLADILRDSLAQHRLSLMNDEENEIS